MDRNICRMKTKNLYHSNYIFNLDSQDTNVLKSINVFIKILKIRFLQACKILFKLQLSVLLNGISIQQVNVDLRVGGSLREAARAVVATICTSDSYMFLILF